MIDDDRSRTVWIVNHYAAPHDAPAGTRHFSLAKGLVDRGHKVTIFASSYRLSTGQQRLPMTSLFGVESHDGVRFVWLRTTPYRGNDWRRSLNMLSFLTVFLVVQTRVSAPDVIIGSTVHPFAAFGAWLAARLRRARFIFEIRDLWPQTLVDLGAMRIGSPGERLLRRLEAFLVGRASSVISLLPGIRDYLAAHDLRTDHVVYIPNGADLEAFIDPAPDVEAPEPVMVVMSEIARLRAEGRMVIGYVGAYGRVNRPDLIVEAAIVAERREPGRIGLVLVGDGAERETTELLAAGKSWIVVGPAVPKLFVPAILNSIDAGIVHTTYTPVYRYGISFNKLFDYMAAERPIIFACDTAYDPVATSGAGVTVPPDDPEALAAAFLDLAGTTPETRAAMGSAGRRHVEGEHDYGRLGDTLDQVVRGRLPR